jgi:hypothetical protein
MQAPQRRPEDGANWLWWNGLYTLRFRRSEGCSRRFFECSVTEVNFRAKDWKHTDFRASGFWNRSFSGALKDITFPGDYLTHSHKEISGPPRKTGLHNVSFEATELHWVGFYNGCELENITLPADGSAFQCKVRNLVVAYSDYDQGAAEYDVFTKYLEIIRPNATEQPDKIISRNDLIELGGDETGALLYDRLRVTLTKSLM